MSCEKSRKDDHWSSFKPLIEGVASKNFNNDSTCGCGGGRTVISSACEVWRGEFGIQWPKLWVRKWYMATLGLRAEGLGFGTRWMGMIAFATLTLNLNPQTLEGVWKSMDGDGCFCYLDAFDLERLLPGGSTKPKGKFVKILEGGRRSRAP